MNGRWIILGLLAAASLVSIWEIGVNAQLPARAVAPKEEKRKQAPISPPLMDPALVNEAIAPAEGSEVFHAACCINADPAAAAYRPAAMPNDQYDVNSFQADFQHRAALLTGDTENASLETSIAWSGRRERPFEARITLVRDEKQATFKHRMVFGYLNERWQLESYSRGMLGAEIHQEVAPGDPAWLAVQQVFGD
jgi:hypothetical protein